MLTITNVAAVNEAFIAKTPRPMREVMLEIYPDATEDRNGRFHAPYDGYVCPITNNEYRGGEYLPMEEPEDGYRVMGNAPVYPNGVDLEGNKHEWSGTWAQNRAAWGAIIEQSKAYDAARSQHVGTVGEKIALELTVQHIVVFPGYYANVHCHILKDDNGNVVIYKKSGGRIVKGRSMGRNIEVQKGDKITLEAKVKSHGEREGVKQTVIERPKVKA